MTGTDKFKLVLVAIVELVLLGGGAALFVIGQTLFGILMIVGGAVSASTVMVLLVLRSRGRPDRQDHDTVA